MDEAGKAQEAGHASARPLLIIAGPTASGKSALALSLAARWGGTIINCDAMQCYRDLAVVTARPTESDEAMVPHCLYGVRAAAQPANAAWWRETALAELAKSNRPILCGGTGMYLTALLHGIAHVPEPGEAARSAARALLARIGPAGLHDRLTAVDPETAAKLKPGDSQRLARAWEVFTGTGRGLAYWQRQPTEGLAGWRVQLVLLDPPRDSLLEAIEHRFAAMLAAGAIEEVKRLLAQNLDPALPLMRAHGVPEIAAHLRGEISLAEAARRAVLATHQYTKRQGTWFRHQKLVADSAMHIIQTKIDAKTKEMESLTTLIDNFMKDEG
jgi:tRNA dimethylallyltransferase